jgi:hypothetical protein
MVGFISLQAGDELWIVRRMIVDEVADNVAVAALIEQNVSGGVAIGFIGGVENGRKNCL